MNIELFKTAVESLFPNLKMKYSVLPFSFAAEEDADVPSIKIIARKEGESMLVTHVSGTHYEVNVIEALESPFTDLLTVEQQQLERLRSLIKTFQDAERPETDYDNTDYKNGLIEGRNRERELLLSVFSEVLNAN